MNEFIDNFKYVLTQKYAAFSGRASRREFWQFQAVLFVIGIVLAIIDNVVGTGGVLGGIVSLATLIPSIAILIRRLHDTDRSGWWVLIFLIPLVGAIVILVFMLAQGTLGQNRFGDDPKVIL